MENLTATQIAIFIAAILSGILAYVIFTNSANTADTRYAATAASLIDGAVNFASTQRSAIITQAGGGTAMFTVANMAAAGSIDPSISPSTPTGGTWCLEFRTYSTPNPNPPPATTIHLQGIIGSAGETNPKKPGDAALVAAQTGRTFAGIVTNGAATGPDFSQLLNAFTGTSCNFGPNAFVAIITDTESVTGNESIALTNFLARVSIANLPAANTMEVPLNMGGKTPPNATVVINPSDIIDANNIYAQGVSTTNAMPANPGEIDGLTFNAATAMNVGPAGGTTGALSVNGAATIGTLMVSGSGTVSGNFTAMDYFHTSDERLKRDWQGIADPMALLAPVRFGSFTWIGTGHRSYGVAAQSLLATLPELVGTDGNGNYAVNYDGFVPIFIAALDQANARAEAADRRAAAAEGQAAKAQHEVLRLRRSLGEPANTNTPRAAIAANR